MSVSYWIQSVVTAYNIWIIYCASGVLLKDVVLKWLPAGENPYRVDGEQIKQRAKLLQKYLKDEQKELQALFALQALMVQMEQPASEWLSSSLPKFDILTAMTVFFLLYLIVAPALTVFSYDVLTFPCTATFLPSTLLLLLHCNFSVVGLMQDYLILSCKGRKLRWPWSANHNHKMKTQLQKVKHNNKTQSQLGKHDNNKKKRKCK